MSINKYLLKITKILNNDLIQGKLTYDKCLMNITVSLYGIFLNSPHPKN